MTGLTPIMSPITLNCRTIMLKKACLLKFSKDKKCRLSLVFASNKRFDWQNGNYEIFYFSAI